MLRIYFKSCSISGSLTIGYHSCFCLFNDVVNLSGFGVMMFNAT